LTRNAQAWAKCGIPVTVVAADTVAPQGTGTVRVQWSEAGSRGNFGLANLGQRTLSLGPKAFGMLHDRNPAHDAMQTLQMVISHEMGHFLGLMAHSRRCVDVLSYYHDGKGGQCYSRDPAGLRSVVEYRHVLPTACDIERCRRINGIGGLSAQ
jgi:predicted Zn-dependent protease